VDSGKIAGIAGSYPVAEFQRARSDDEIAQRKTDPLSGLLTAETGYDLRSSGVTG
jgi:hypothetical protein